MKKIKHFTKRMLAIMLAGALTMGSLPVSAFGAADIGNVASTSDVAEEVISDASDYEDVDNGNVASTSDNVEEVISDASDYEDADNGNVASTSDVAEEVNSDASDYEDADEATDSIEDKYEEMAEVESTESSEEEVLPEEVSEVEEASETGEAEEPIEDAEPIETEKGLEQEEVILPKNVEKAVPEETIVTDRQDAGSNDFTIEDGVLTEYSGNGGNVVIPEGVTSLGNNTFYDCDSLTEITIPDSVTAIGDYVFYNCDSLTKVTLGTGVAKIGTYAFAYCYKLENLRVNGDVAEYGSWVFDGTGDNIRTLEIGSGVTELNSTLYSMSGLSEILVDSGNKAYYSGKGMLYKGTVLVKCPWCKESDFEILDGTTEIGANAFYECDNLTEITIPDSVTAIGDNAFYDCDSLESISISEGTQSIGSYGFAYCEKLESIQLPDSVTSIARYAFYNDSKLTIYCSVDSFAAKYAAENKIKYITDTYCIQFKLYKNCSVVQGQAQDKVEDFIRNYTVSLYDQTTEKKLTGFMVHQNAIVLQSGTVSPGDEIIINIVSKRGETVDYETSIILDDQIRADAEFTVQQKGYVSILLRSRDKISSILVYDGNGSFCEAMESSGDQKMSRFLTSGDYQIVFIQGENYLWKFEDISLFNGNGLEEKKDFILEKVTVQDGVVSRLDSIEVPAIDTELLRYLDGSTASYTVNTNQSASGSLLSFKIEYALKELRKDAVKNINLRINIPEGCNYVSGSLTIDGKATTQVSENSTMISVPLSATEGVIRFSARPISYGKITTTAYLYFNAENRNHTETIGMLDIDIPYITLSCQSETSSKRVHVDGLTIPKERVAIYDGFTRIGTLTSNASGKWSGEVTLATATEGSTHALRAKVYPGTEKN